MDTNGTHEVEFMAIAQTFLQERARQPGDTLPRYVERYPAYARELMLLASETALAEGSPAVAMMAEDAPSADLLKRLRTDARATLLSREGQDAPVTSLVARAREHAGLTPRVLAQRLAIGVDVLALLDEGHIRADTVATAFVRRVAETLGTSLDAVQVYLAAPGRQGAVAYHAPQGHMPARGLSFAEALDKSPLTTAEQRAYWLGERVGDDAASPEHP